MLSDITWLSQQAKEIHIVFHSWFYILITIFLLLGIVIEFFKLPLGGVPSSGVLVGRAIVASILMYAYPEITNTLADLIDAVCSKLGDLNNFNLVLSKMGDNLNKLTWSWISFKDSIVGILSYLSFFLLYISVYAIQAFMIFSWSLLYVFSPLLISLFVLPATATATKVLFRSLIEVSMWKVAWSVLATLLWSFALSEINEGKQEINFLTAIFLNLILAGSLLLTPMVVSALSSQGISSLASQAGGIVAGATMGAPMAFANNLKNKTVQTVGGISSVGGGVLKSGQFLNNKIRNRPIHPAKILNNYTKTKNKGGY